MIPANGAQHVYYLTDQELPGPIRQVLAWDNDGHPMVLGNCGLERAADLGTIQRVRQDAAAVVGAVPGDGWFIEYQDDEGTKWVTPILAWTVHADGSATPITSDQDGLTDDATSGLTTYRVYHPDEACTRQEPPVATCDPDCRECSGTSWVAIPDGEWDASKHQHAPVRRCRCFRPAQEVTA